MNDIAKALIIFLFFVAVLIVLFPLYKQNIDVPQNIKKLPKQFEVNNMNNDATKMLTATNYMGDEIYFEPDNEKAIIDNYCKYMMTMNPNERELYGDKMFEDSEREIDNNTLKNIINANNGMLAYEGEINAQYDDYESNENQTQEKYEQKDVEILVKNEFAKKAILDSDKTHNIT